MFSLNVRLLLRVRVYIKWKEFFKVRLFKGCFDPCIMVNAQEPNDSDAVSGEKFA